MASQDSTLDRRSFLKAAGGAAAATSMTAGCLGSLGGGGGGGTLTYARGNKSGTLDPQATSSGEDAKVIQQLYDTVIKFEPGKTTLRDGLASNYELDGTTVTLELREGINFHNGEELTADDFIATYNRFLKEDYEHFVGEETRSYYGPYLLGVVSEVSKDGDYSINVELNKKHAPMLRNLAVFAFGIVSKSAIESSDPLRENPVGTGPFELDEWDTSNNQIRLTANSEYWGDAPSVDQVVFTEIKENSQRAQALTTGDVDIIDGLDPNAADQVDGAENTELMTVPGINVGYMAMNMARKEPFRFKRVRQAFNYAIDTQSIVENIYSGLAVQASQPVPSNMSGYVDEIDPYPHDPDMAQQLLTEAGYRDGFEMELATFQNPRTYNPSPLDAAQAVKSNLEDVGISVTVKQMEFNAFIEYTTQGKHDACFLGWMTDNADPDNFFFALLHPGAEPPTGQDWLSFDTEGFNTLNVAAWANREYKTLVEEAQETYDNTKRIQKYEEASRIAHEEAPWVFIDHAKELRGVHERVSDFVVAPISGPYLNLVSLE